MQDDKVLAVSRSLDKLIAAYLDMTKLRLVSTKLCVNQCQKCTKDRDDALPLEVGTIYDM